MPTLRPSTKVLVVDDHDDCRESMVMLLEAKGYEVISAADGFAGLEAAQQHRPDIILTDIGMPVMDGLQFARAIREDSTLKNTVLVAVSGWDKRQLARHPGLAAFDRHLVKPASIDAVLEAVSAAPRVGPG